MIRKIFAAVMLLLVMSSISWGANSDDVYVRKDVLEAIMKSIDTKFDTLVKDIQDMKTEIRDMKAEIANIRKDINAINNTVATLVGRIDGLEHRMGMLETVIYWVIGIIGAALTLAGIVPLLIKLLREFITPPLKIEDMQRLVQKLIEENNAMLLKKFQGGINN